MKNLWKERLRLGRFSCHHNKAVELTTPKFGNIKVVSHNGASLDAERELKILARVPE